jgi:hypothetical protein
MTMLRNLATSAALRLRLLPTALLLAFLAALVPLSLTARPVLAQESSGEQTQGGETQAEEGTYDQNEILEKARGFFGETTEGLAKAIEKVFEDQGRPNAYIAGEELSGAIGLGVVYGEGTLNRKIVGSRQVFWQGPSIGFVCPGLQPARYGKALSAIPCGRRQPLCGRWSRRQLSKERQYHPRPHPHGCWPARRR